MHGVHLQMTESHNNNQHGVFYLYLLFSLIFKVTAEAGRSDVRIMRLDTMACLPETCNLISYSTIKTGLTR